MSGKIYNVLFLCTGNSARSILAEALLNARSGGRFQAHSAGSHPKTEPHPMALGLLARQGLNTAGLRSKSWDEFVKPGSPRFDFVFTVCDNAAGEVCPVWFGNPLKIHWGIADPAAVTGSYEARCRAFAAALAQLEKRVDALIALPLDRLDLQVLQDRLSAIGSEPMT